MPRASAEQVRADLEWALDEVARQLASLPEHELLETEDLEWSMDAPHGRGVFVAVTSRRPSGAQLAMTLTATCLRWFGLRGLYRSSRQVTVPLR